MNRKLDIVRRDHILKMLENGERMDGRSPEEIRDIKVERSIIATAEGSSRVRLGDTTVIVGVKAMLGTPYPDHPEEGTMSVQAQMGPIAAPEFDAGPQNPDEIELARVVDRGIRESGAIDFRSLCITPGSKVWSLYMDIHVIDYDGNLFDAASIGVLTALDNTTIPGLKYDEGPDRPLNLNSKPVSITVAKIGDYMVVDPSLEEEMVASSRLTIVTDDNGDIRAVQKGIGGAFTIDEIKKAYELSRDIGAQIREELFSLDDVVR